MVSRARRGTLTSRASSKGYAADPNLPALAAGTPVHFICYEFRGRELVRLEEVFPAG